MATLKSSSRQKLLLPKLGIADSFWSRGVGLLGRSSLAEDEALWLRGGNSIHTCFMAFAIDCVFLNRNLEVKAIHRDVKPWRMVWPVWGANSVIEMAAGTAARLGIEVGEKLDVGT